MIRVAAWSKADIEGLQEGNKVKISIRPRCLEVISEARSSLELAIASMRSAYEGSEQWEDRALSVFLATRPFKSMNCFNA
jgi:hypothetical protein